MNTKNGYYMTESAVLRFRKWLLVQHLTVNSFSRKCECTRQYIEQVLAGKKKITQSVIERFNKGGYDLI